MKVVSTNALCSKPTPVFDTHTLVARRKVSAEQIEAGEVPYEVRLRLQEISDAIDRILAVQKMVSSEQIGESNGNDRTGL